MGNRKFADGPRTESSVVGHRHQRLQELLHEELAALFRDDVEDPSLDGLVVRAVVLSVDYRNARVHLAGNSPSSTGQAEARALARVTPFLRARLAESLDLKRVPELHFVLDR